MTLEQLGFVRVPMGSNRFVFKREKLLTDYHEWIEFNPIHKDFDISGIYNIDMILLEAIYTKAKELFV